MSYTVRYASTTEDRDLAFALRREVFEVEQNVPRPLDRDAFDLNADHVVVFDDRGACIATGRAVRLDSRTCQIGRQVTARSHRGTGVGAKVLDALERMVALRGLREIRVHSQLPAIPFYQHRGFEQVGDTFLEEGVPHVLMRKLIVGD